MFVEQERIGCSEVVCTENENDWRAGHEGIYDRRRCA